MISVEQVFQSVKDLATKDMAGYFSSGEFNRASRLAEDELYAELFAEYEGSQQISDPLRVFVKTVMLPCTDGLANYPPDFRSRIEVEAAVVTNTAGNPDVSYKPARYIHPQEVAASFENGIRKPTAGEMYRHTNTSKGIQMYPNCSSIRIKYLALPIYAVRGFTVDVTNFEADEDYDALTSTDYQWPSEMMVVLVRKILFYLGFAIKSPETVNFSQS